MGLPVSSVISWASLLEFFNTSSYILYNILDTLREDISLITALA